MKESVSLLTFIVFIRYFLALSLSVNLQIKRKNIISVCVCGGVCGLSGSSTALAFCDYRRFIFNDLD